MRVCAILFVLILAQCAAATPLPTGRPTRLPMTPDVAAQNALQNFQNDSFVGHLAGPPVWLRGKVMSLGDAFLLVNGHPLTAGSRLTFRQDRPVWLVITRGTWLLHIQGGHGDPRQRTPTVMSKDILVSDLMSEQIFDAATGETYDQGGVAATQRAQAESLPLLTTPLMLYTPSPFVTATRSP